MTVGSGVSPDLLTLNPMVEALAGLKLLFLTAGGEFRPALRTVRQLHILG